MFFMLSKDENDDKDKNINNNINLKETVKSLAGPFVFFYCTIIYLELIFHIIIYGSIDTKIILPILFALPVTILFTLLSGLGSKKINRIIIWVLTALTCLIFAFQITYYDVFKVFFSLQTVGLVKDAVSEFYKDIFTAIKDNLSGLVLAFAPLIILSYIQNKVFDYKKRDNKVKAVLFAFVIVSHFFVLLALFLFGKEDYTPYDLYYNNRVPQLSGKHLGLITFTRFDLEGLIRGDEELVLDDIDDVDDAAEDVWDDTPTKPNDPMPVPSVTPIPTPIPVDSSPNIMDIDFDYLAERESNNTISILHNYFASVTPTNKNEYTGMFEGYNLIMITAEGFSPYAVHEELTPTLHKLVNSGFVFEDFYTPLWQTSTSDGEFVAMTGLIPVGTRSMYYSRNNMMPFALGNQFNKLGVNSKAYHNHTYTYYERDQTHPNLGYDFVGIGNGLVLESDVWPRSDLEMINNTVDEFIYDDRFHVYYLTVSGHMNYTFEGNSMSQKNRNLVEHLPYSSEAKAYIACQIELDKALESLINSLEEVGAADKTVIALSSDHHPYGWEKAKLDELAGYEIEPYFEIFKNHFILWNANMDEKVIIDEPSSSLDILPTLSNLFGLEYDSRLLMGRDVLSDAPPLVVFNDRSFITDKVMYNTTNGRITYLTSEELPDNYVNNINNIVRNKFTVSEKIVSEDYYSYLFSYE